MTDPSRLGLLEAAGLLRARVLSATELLAACMSAIGDRNGGDPSFDGAPASVNAWVRLYPEVADAQARAADARIARERHAAPLVCGIPIGLKDLFGVAGLPVTASSQILAGNVADGDSIAWARLARKGMVLVGHTHTHEFAAGTTTDQVGNPVAIDHSAGGSSGGSAAALAADMVPAALGTDTGGSLRIPAAMCGVSAIKPTHGRIPINGIVPLAASLDHAGPMARSVADCGALLDALADGEAQSTPLMPPPAALDRLPTAARTGPRPLAGMRIAVTDRMRVVTVEPDVYDGLDAARAACRALGARIVELPAPEAGALAFRTVMFAEVAAYHAHHAALAGRYRASTREFVERAADYSRADRYIDAQASRARLTTAWEAWFADHAIDALLEPTVPMTPRARGGGYAALELGDEVEQVSALTFTWNVTGFPVVAIPAGRGSRTGLPVGVSLIAPRGRESAVVQLAIDLQEHQLGAMPDH